MLKRLNIKDRFYMFRTLSRVFKLVLWVVIDKNLLFRVRLSLRRTWVWWCTSLHTRRPAGCALRIACGWPSGRRSSATRTPRAPRWRSMTRGGRTRRKPRQRARRRSPHRRRTASWRWPRPSETRRSWRRCRSPASPEWATTIRVWCRPQTLPVTLEPKNGPTVSSGTTKSEFGGKAKSQTQICGKKSAPIIASCSKIQWCSCKFVLCFRVGLARLQFWSGLKASIFLSSR